MPHDQNVELATQEFLNSKDELDQEMKRSEAWQRTVGSFEKFLTELAKESLRKHIIVPVVHLMNGKNSRLRRLRFPMGGRCSGLREKIQKARETA